MSKASMVRQYEMAPRWFVTWAKYIGPQAEWVTHISMPFKSHRAAQSLVSGLKMVDSIDCIEITGPIYLRRPTGTFKLPDRRGRMKDDDGEVRF